MKRDIHPEYVDATIRCACGNSWATRSTKADMHVEVCSNCHPFFTGEQRIVDTAGRVERFRRRYARVDQQRAQTEQTEQAEPAPDAAPEDAEATVEPAETVAE